MKKFLIVFAFLFILPAYAGLYDDLLDDSYPPRRRIEYGYNAEGDYVPMSIGNHPVQYGYNAEGKYVPMSVGNRQIQYGYNAEGDYVPIEY